MDSDLSSTWSFSREVLSTVSWVVDLEESGVSSEATSVEEEVSEWDVSE